MQMMSKASTASCSIIKLIETICFNLNIMTPEKKLCQIKRTDRDSNLQSQKIQLLLEPIVDKKVTFITRRLNHSATQCNNQAERKRFFYIYSERQGGL